MRASFARPTQLLLDAVRERVTPCAVAEVGSSAGMVWRDAVGALTYEDGAPGATTRTVFDLASLTKVISTTPIAMRAVNAGLRVDAPVRQWLEGWSNADRSAVTIADLLEHASGLPAVAPLHARHSGRAAVERAICELPLDYSPRTKSVYSDLGFMLLGFILEDVGGAPLGAQFDALVQELDLARDSDVLCFGPLGKATPLEDVAPTQFDPWRNRLLQGEVDDRNGAALGGVAGHTGLFGTVGAVGRFARRMLAATRGDATGAALPWPVEIVRRFLRASSVPGSSRALGWDTMRTTSSCGTRMSADAFGHTGFTGTSMWVDPRADVYAVLLTNRVHPQAGGAESITALRRAFHDAVMTEAARRVP